MPRDTLWVWDVFIKRVTAANDGLSITGETWCETHPLKCLEPFIQLGLKVAPKGY